MMDAIVHSTEPAEAATLVWSDAFELGYGKIDDVHEEFVHIINTLAQSSDTDFLARLEDVIAHAQAHFDMEDSWMRETAFPPAACHIDEHAAVLKSAFEARALAGTGDIEFGRQFAADLIRWFPGHVSFLDSALATWMFKRQHGGRPLVLHRGAALISPLPTSPARR